MSGSAFITMLAFGWENGASFGEHAVFCLVSFLAAVLASGAMDEQGNVRKCLLALGVSPGSVLHFRSSLHYIIGAIHKRLPPIFVFLTPVLPEFVIPPLSGCPTLLYPPQPM